MSGRGYQGRGDSANRILATATVAVLHHRRPGRASARRHAATLKPLAALPSPGLRTESLPCLQRSSGTVPQAARVSDHAQPRPPPLQPAGKEARLARPSFRSPRRRRRHLRPSHSAHQPTRRFEHAVGNQESRSVAAAVAASGGRYLALYQHAAVAVVVVPDSTMSGPGRQLQTAERARVSDVSMQR